MYRPINTMAACRQNEHATDGSSSSYVNNEKSHRQCRWIVNRVSVIAVDIIHVANIDIRLEIVRKLSQ